MLYRSKLSPLVQDDLADQVRSLKVSEESSASELAKCSLCGNAVHFDVNTGNVFKFCEHHLNKDQTLSDSSDEDDVAGVGSISATEPTLQASASPIPTQQNKCAIEECNEPRHVDPNGTVHECCGYTHAMEHIRRRILERKKCSL